LFIMNPLDRASDPGMPPPDPATITPKTGESGFSWERPVYFPEWKAILDLEPVDPLTRHRFARSIISTSATAKRAMNARRSRARNATWMPPPPPRAPARPSDADALRRFFRAYRRVCESAPSARAHPVDVQPPTSMPILPGTPP
jgi:hypothetical protein